MGNRYTKTGFTSRQKDKLNKIRNAILDIIDARNGKQDSPAALNRLFQAHTALTAALDESERWLKDD